MHYDKAAENNTFLVQPEQDTLLPVTDPHGKISIYGSKDGWLCCRDEAGVEFYLVPEPGFKALDGKIRRRDTGKTWYHLGEFYLVED
jgi:hypothetical protein